jgi:hypothetical protein
MFEVTIHSEDAKTCVGTKRRVRVVPHWMLETLATKFRGLVCNVTDRDRYRYSGICIAKFNLINN